MNHTYTASDHGWEVGYYGHAWNRVDPASGKVMPQRGWIALETFKAKSVAVAYVNLLNGGSGTPAQASFLLAQSNGGSGE